MVIPILLLIVAILCLIAVFRGLKQRNFLAVVYAGISTLVLGWFSIMSIIKELFPNI